MKTKIGTVMACSHCGQEYIVKNPPLGPYVCSKQVCKDAENKRLMETGEPNDTQRKFDETRAAEAKRIAGKPGVRLDYRTGQYVPTIDGKDASPTTFDEQRAKDIAQQICEREANTKHTATAADRAKDPYLSADSIVYEGKAEAAKHTPGPWRVVVPPSSWLTYRFIEAETGEHIAKIGHLDYSAGRPADIANAAFIVQACNAHDELLEACKVADKELERLIRLSGDSRINTISTRAKLRAAIAKAEGREP